MPILYLVFNEFARMGRFKRFYIIGNHFRVYARKFYHDAAIYNG